MSSSMKSLSAAVLAALVTAVAVAACGGGGGAAAKDKRDLTIYETVEGVKTVDAKPAARKGELSVGDRVLTKQGLFDADKKRIGTLYTDCASVGDKATLFKATLACTGTYRLPGGSIVASGASPIAPGQKLAITGGTGSHRSASGEVEIAKPSKGYDSVDVLHLDG